jgi:hypothetical protein
MKKADAVEHPGAPDHVGLLVNTPQAAEGLFVSSSDFIHLY